MPETIERIAVLETRLDSIENRLDNFGGKIDSVKQVTDTLRGAKYVGWFIAASFGYIVHTILPLFTGKH